jgi:hypothetical protein
LRAAPKQLCQYPLTPNTPLIHTLFTFSKLNMDDFSVPAGPLGYVDNMHEVDPCAKEVIFIPEFALLCKNPPFFEVKKIF